MRIITHFIDGATAPQPGRTGDVYSPNTGLVQAKVELGDSDTLACAVDSARAAQRAWAATNPQRRARVMFRFKGKRTTSRVLRHSGSALMDFR